jgi:hypothetical protein
MDSHTLQFFFILSSFFFRQRHKKIAPFRAILLDSIVFFAKAIAFAIPATAAMPFVLTVFQNFFICQEKNPFIFLLNQIDEGEGGGHGGGGGGVGHGQRVARKRALWQAFLFIFREKNFSAFYALCLTAACQDSFVS